MVKLKAILGVLTYRYNSCAPLFALTFLLQACTLARRNAEHFLKYVSRNVITLSMKVTRDPQNQVKHTLEHLHKQENTVLEFWTARKKSLDQCQQYVKFEQSATQVRVER